MKFLMFTYFVNVSLIYAYKPVILMHGLVTGVESMAVIKGRILENHPGTIVYNIKKFSYALSVENMWNQLEEVGRDIVNFSKKYPQGVHLIGYSQGALLCRSILQYFPEHNVKHFISLSGPQAGIYGSAIINLSGSNVVLLAASAFYYSLSGQRISVGNYWKDLCHLDSYYKYSNFLPFVDNELNSSNTQKLKRGIVKLKKMVLLGSPDDGMITPWQSSHFGYYEVCNGSVVTMKNRPIYKEDHIGLRTLDEIGRLKIITIPGIIHFVWPLNLSIIDNNVLPYLD